VGAYDVATAHFAASFPGLNQQRHQKSHFNSWYTLILGALAQQQQCFRTSNIE
jgi:hypothetical protein